MTGEYSLHHPVDRGSELRVFISSTFRDMQAEREHLIKHVFPEINHICRERGVTFTDIDLRWGITEKQAEKRKIVQTCLHEIHRRQPIVIGIIGSRYGWVPPIEEVSDPRLLQLYPMIRAAAAQGSSMVEIEIMEGVLRNPFMNGRAFFYFRDPSIETERIRESAAAQKRLGWLKDAMRESSFPVRESYTSLHMFGEWVRQDLLHLLNTEYPVKDQNDPLIEERHAHEAFAATRRRSYVEIPKYLNRLDEHVHGDGPPLIVTGKSGMGKSALLAYWCERYRKSHPRDFVIQHFVGATSASSHIAVIRHIMMEIKARYRDFPDTVPVKEDAIIQALPYWLGQVQHEKLILVIDGLNQLDERSQQLDWLGHIQPRVRLIISTLEGPALDKSREHGWPKLEVEPLTKKVRREIVKRYLSQYGKQFTAEQLQRIADDPASATALMLKTRLEELRIFGSHEKLNERISYYLSIQNLDDLFQCVLERLEGDYGRRHVENVMSLLWASRRGLSETELLELTHTKRADLSVILFALDYHLSTRDGLLTFFHDYLRQAVSKRYISATTPAGSARKRKSIHRQIAHYFADQELTSRRIEEQPWQLKEAGAWEPLLQCITEKEMFLELFTESRQYDLLGYITASGRITDAFDLSRKTLENIGRRKEGCSGTQFAIHVGELALLAARLDIAETFITIALKKEERSKKGNHLLMVNVLRSLGSVYLAQGKYEKAEAKLLKALQRCEDDRMEPEVCAGILDGLASLYYEWKQPSKAVHHAEQSLEMRRHLYGDEHARTISAMQGLAACLHAANQYEQAEFLFSEALRLCRHIMGRKRPLTAKLLNNLGAVQMTNKNFDGAVGHLKEALTLNLGIFGEEHTETASVLINLGYALKASNDHEGAEHHYRRAISVCERLLGEDHPVVARHRITLATVLGEQGKLEEAEALSRKALQERIRHLGENHRDTVSAQLNLACVYYWKKEYTVAMELFDTYFTIGVEMLGENHPHIIIYAKIYAKLLMESGVESVHQPLQHLRKRSDAARRSNGKASR